MRIIRVAKGEIFITEVTVLSILTHVTEKFVIIF